MIHADVGCRLHSRRRVAQAELEALEAQNDRPYLRSVFRAADMDMVGGSRKNRLDAPLRRTEANHARFKYLIIETKATGKQLEQFCTNTCGSWSFRKRRDCTCVKLAEAGEGQSHYRQKRFVAPAVYPAV